MASAVVFNTCSALLDIPQCSCSWSERFCWCRGALDPQTRSLPLDFHWGLPGWDQPAARCDVTPPQLQSWCDYHPRNHCQAVETKLPCLFLQRVPPALSLCPPRLCECSRWARLPSCDVMPSGARLITVTSPDQSHTVWAISSLDMGLSLLPSQKKVKNRNCSPDWMSELAQVFLSPTQSTFSVSVFPVTRAWPNPLKWLYQLKSFI